MNIIIIPELVQQFISERTILEKQLLDMQPEITAANRTAEELNGKQRGLNDRIEHISTIIESLGSLS